MKEPVLAFTYQLGDGAAIATANATADPWGDTAVANLKSRFKALHLGVQNSLCCYCRRDFTAEFQMVIDIEHVLPASKYAPLRFNVLNLSVACKRCNMFIKREYTGFLVNEANLGGDYWNSAQYKLLHPNIDNYEASLMRYAVQRGIERIVFYHIIDRCPKGIYTKELFRLQEFETDSFDRSQFPNLPPANGWRQRLRRLVAGLRR